MGWWTIFTQKNFSDGADPGPHFLVFEPEYLVFVFFFTSMPYTIPEYWIQHLNLLYIWKVKLQSKKMRPRVGPVWKFFLSENCSPTHFVPKSPWKFFLDHYYGSYEHLIIADCLIVSPLPNWIWDTWDTSKTEILGACSIYSYPFPNSRTHIWECNLRHSR